jgi:hypothetical protein
MRNRLHLPAHRDLAVVAATSSLFAEGTGAGSALGTARGVGTNPPVGAQNPGSAGITMAPGRVIDHDDRHGLQHKRQSTISRAFPTPRPPAGSAPERCRAACRATIRPIRVSQGRSANSDISQRAAIKRRPPLGRFWNQSGRAKSDPRFR